LLTSQNIIRNIKSKKMRRAKHLARIGKDRKVYKVLMGKPKLRRPLGRRRHRWEDEITMDLGEIAGGCGADSNG
jgi:hypothetical protein